MLRSTRGAQTQARQTLASWTAVLTTRGSLQKIWRGGTPCTDTIDNDQDGFVDCDDPDCAPLPYCADEICDNEWDDNANGLTDCDDPACEGSTACLDRVTICDLHEAGYFAQCTNCHQDRFDNQGNRISEASGNFRVDHWAHSKLFDSMNTPGSQNRASFVSGNAEQSMVYAKIAGTQTQLNPPCADGDTDCVSARRSDALELGAPI